MRAYYWRCTSLLLCVLGIGASDARIRTATVDVDAGAILKPVERQLFGANVEWNNDGNLIWNAATGSNNGIIVSRARELGVSNLRFPGGTLADYYHWRDGIGPRMSRPVSPHGIDAGYSPQNFGLHEFMELCRATGAEALLQANVISGSATEAAQWVEYCNAPHHAERTANGSPEPFAVRLWEIGNEQYLQTWDGKGSPSLLTADEYVNRLVAFATAMKSVDPTIKIGAVGGKNFGRYAVVANDDWNRVLLERAAPHIDFISLHNGYGPVVLDPDAQTFWDVYSALLAFPKLVEENLRSENQQILDYAPAQAQKMQIAVTEWGPLFHVLPDHPYVDHAKTLGSGVFTASMLRTFLLADRVAIANIFQLSQPIFLGIMNHEGVVKPSYLALQMYSRYFGTTLVATDVVSATYDSPAVGLVSAVSRVPYIEAISSLSADHTRMYVILINKHFNAAINVNVQLHNFPAGPSVVRRLMTGPGVDANNGSDLVDIPGVIWAAQRAAPVNPMFDKGAPGTVRIQEAILGMSGTLTYSAPPMSVTALEFSRQ